MDAAGFADSAGKDRVLAHAVADHKNNRFAESMPDGAPIDYRDGPAFVEFLNKDADRINAAIRRIGKVD